MTKKKYKLINVFIYILITKGMDKGLISRNNKVLKRVADYCFDDWARFKLAQTMKDVDKQIKNLTFKTIEETKKEIQYRYSQTEKGSTPLGGPMRLSAPWKNKDE